MVGASINKSPEGMKHNHSRSGKRKAHGAIRELSRWLITIPFVLAILLASSQLALIGKISVAQANTNSLLKADYGSWAHLSLASIEHGIIAEIGRDIIYANASSENILDPIDATGSFLPEPSETQSSPGDMTTATATASGEYSSSTPASTASETDAAAQTATASAAGSVTPGGSATITGTTETPVASETPTNAPSATWTQAVTDTPTPVPSNTPAPTSTQSGSTLISTFWLYDDTSPHKYMMYQSQPSGSFAHKTGIFFFYSIDLPNNAQLSSGTTTVHFTAINSRQTAHSVSVTLKSGSNTLGSGSISIPGLTITPTNFSFSFSTSAHIFSGGSKSLVATFDSLLGGVQVIWDGDYSTSRIVVPKLTSP